MDVWDSLVALSLIDRLVGIPLGVFKRRYLSGVNLQIVRIPVAAVDELCQVFKIHLLAVDPLDRNVKLPGFLLNHRSQPLSGLQQ